MYIQECKRYTSVNTIKKNLSNNFVTFLHPEGCLDRVQNDGEMKT